LAPSTLDTLQDCLGGGALASIFLTLLVGPVVHAVLTARFLTSIRKARALEEVVATPLTPRRVVDALAVHGVRQALQTLAPPLAFCTGLFWLSGWAPGIPAVGLPARQLGPSIGSFPSWPSRPGMERLRTPSLG